MTLSCLLRRTLTSLGPQHYSPLHSCALWSGARSHTVRSPPSLPMKGINEENNAGRLGGAGDRSSGPGHAEWKNVGKKPDLNGGLGPALSAEGTQCDGTMSPRSVMWKSRLTGSTPGASSTPSGERPSPFIVAVPKGTKVVAVGWHPYSDDASHTCSPSDRECTGLPTCTSIGWLSSKDHVTNRRMAAG